MGRGSKKYCEDTVQIIRMAMSVHFFRASLERTSSVEKVKLHFYKQDDAIF